LDGIIKEGIEVKYDEPRARHGLLHVLQQAKELVIEIDGNIVEGFYTTFVLKVQSNLLRNAAQGEEAKDGYVAGTRCVQLLFIVTQKH